MNARSQDALSDILRLIRLKAYVYFQQDFSSPWGMEMDASKVAQFHLIVRGQCWLTLDIDRHLLTTGDIVVVPHGDAHALLDDPATSPTPGKDVLAAIQSGAHPSQGGETTARIICGHFEFERELNHPLIRDLPRLIHIKGMGSRQLGWLDAIIPMLVSETGTNEPGEDAIIVRLAEVLLIQILRTHLLEHTEGLGFLAAIGDRRINGALRFIHLGAGNNITLADIARAAGMSRSSLAGRFKELVGDTPMNYLTNWRMLKAKDILTSETLPLADIAERVGYTSEAAFSRAFKRENDQSPSAYRRTMVLGHRTRS